MNYSDMLEIIKKSSEKDLKMMMIYITISDESLAEKAIRAIVETSE